MRSRFYWLNGLPQGRMGGFGTLFEMISKVGPPHAEVLKNWLEPQHALTWKYFQNPPSALEGDKENCANDHTPTKIPWLIRSSCGLLSYSHCSRIHHRPGNMQAVLKLATAFLGLVGQMLCFVTLSSRREWESLHDLVNHGNEFLHHEILLTGRIVNLGCPSYRLC